MRRVCGFDVHKGMKNIIITSKKIFIFKSRIPIITTHKKA